MVVTVNRFVYRSTRDSRDLFLVDLPVVGLDNSGQDGVTGDPGQAEDMKCYHNYDYSFFPILEPACHRSTWRDKLWKNIGE